MAASVAVPGFASVLQIGNATGTSVAASNYTTIAEIDNISGPSITRNAINVSHMESPNGWEEYKPGMVDGGEVTLDVNLILGATSATANHVGAVLNTLVRNNPTNQAGIGTSLPRNFKIIWPDATVTAITSSTNTWKMDGFVTAFSPSAPHNDKLAASMTIKVTGEVLFS